MIASLSDGGSHLLSSTIITTEGYICKKKWKDRFVERGYQKFLGYPMEQIRLGQQYAVNSNNSGAVGKFVGRRTCAAYNLGIKGATHVGLCIRPTIAHKNAFHRCTICYLEHAMYNCPWLRCYMRLTPFTSIHAWSDTQLPARTARYGGGGGKGGGKGGGRGNFNNRNNQSSDENYNNKNTQNNESSSSNNSGGQNNGKSGSKTKAPKNESG